MCLNQAEKMRRVQMTPILIHWNLFKTNESRSMPTPPSETQSFVPFQENFTVLKTQSSIHPHLRSSIRTRSKLPYSLEQQVI